MADEYFLPILIVAYGSLVMAASLFGGWLPQLVHLTHTRTQLAMSFVAGLMLGVGLLHLLPHAAAHTGPLDLLVGWMMAGLLVMFMLIRALDFHHHGPVEDGAAHIHEPGHAHDHAHSHAAHRFSWLGAAIGMVLHAVIDGVALAASVMADAHLGGRGWFGIGTFLAVLFHKPLDAFPVTTLMASSGWSPRARGIVNILFALTCPIGIGLFFLGWQHLGADHERVLGCALAFSAGVFLCISLGDLLPEVHFHRHDRVKLSAALLLGVALAYGIRYLEPPDAHGTHQLHGHDHEHGHEHDHD